MGFIVYGSRVTKLQYPGSEKRLLVNYPTLSGLNMTAFYEGGLFEVFREGPMSIVDHGRALKMNQS